MDLKSVLNNLLAMTGENITQFSRRIGYPQPTIYRIQKGETLKPELETLAAIAKGFSLTVDELSSAKDPVAIAQGRLKPTMTRDSVAPYVTLSGQTPQQAIAWENPEDLPPDAYAFVERRAVKLSAGDGRLTFEEERLPPLAFRADFFQRKRVSSRINLVIVYADGESMEPYIQDGDVVLIDRGQVEIIDNEIYAIDYGGQLKIKRLQKRFDGGLMIKSDNVMKFPLESVDPPQAKMIKVLGRCLWRGG